MVSLPAPALIVSLPPAPSIRLAFESPEIVSALAEPVTFSILVRTSTSVALVLADPAPEPFSTTDTPVPA